MIALAVYILAGASVCNTPPSVAAAAVVTAWHAGERPALVLGYLCSEHRGGRWSGKCSSAGACGPFQLSATWPVEFGHPDEARQLALPSASMFVELVGYSRQRHASCAGEHDWRAHIKCGPGGRDECTGPVRRWRESEAQILEWLEALEPDGA